VSRFLQFVVASLLCCLTGCAGISPEPAVTEIQSRQVLAAWAELADADHDCPSVFDARVSVSLKSLWHSGTITGYLQAIPPSYMKFVGVNPFGQPVLLLATDGDSFEYVPVVERKVFRGKVGGRAFARYIPQEAVPVDGFFSLLTGKTPFRQQEVLAISGDDQGRGYWLTLGDDGQPVSRVLFNPADGLLYGHIILDGAGDEIMGVIYSDYMAGECPLPSFIKISSGASAAAMEIRVAEMVSGTMFMADDFYFTLPADFDRMEIK